MPKRERGTTSSTSDSHVFSRRDVGEEDETGEGRLGLRHRPELILVRCLRRRAQNAPSSDLYCGNNVDAKSVAAQLIRDVGFEPIDAGPLRIARYLEPFTLAIAHLAYEGDEGPELAYRIERFGK